MRWLHLVWPFRECREGKVSKWSSRNAGWLIYLSHTMPGAMLHQMQESSVGGWGLGVLIMFTDFHLICIFGHPSSARLNFFSYLRHQRLFVERISQLLLPKFTWTFSPHSYFCWKRAVTLFGMDVTEALLRGRCYCKAKGTWHPILAATMGRRDASQFGGSDCSRLIEACQVSAEDLGFRVATLSPSLRHIPTASTHLPKINCTALTPSSPPSPSNLAFTSNNEDPCLIQFSWHFFFVLTHIISVGCRWIKHVFHWMQNLNITNFTFAAIFHLKIK